MKTIENLKDLDTLLNEYPGNSDNECVLRVYDNKSDVLLQSVVVKHPVIFIRDIQNFCKTVNLPVSDVSVQLIGYISPANNFYEIDDICEISPYVYFKKPEDTKDSDVE